MKKSKTRARDGYLNTEGGESIAVSITGNPRKPFIPSNAAEKLAESFCRRTASVDRINITSKVLRLKSDYYDPVH
jgi:hypothetical protein